MTAAAEKIPILLVEDDPSLRRLLRTSLGAQGYRLIEAVNGAEGLAAIAGEKPEAIILDLGLPDMDGLDIIRRARAQGSKIPILVLSSREHEQVKVEAFELGADDYVTKPFGMAELVARLRVALRHRIQEQGGEPVFRSGDLTVDLVRRLVTVRGERVKLSPKEYEILRLLVLHAGRVLTHGFLTREIWGSGGDNIQYLRIYVRQLRQKIEKDPERPAQIVTETGVGYRFEVEDARQGAPGAN